MSFFVIDDLHAFPCININKAESNVIYALQTLKILKDKPQCINDENKRELLTIPGHMCLEDIIDVIKSAIKNADNDIINNEVRIEQEKTKQEQEKAKAIIIAEQEKTKQLQLQVKIAELKRPMR